MNALVAGKDPTPVLAYVQDPYLIIDDGSVIDALTFPDPLPGHWGVTYFDVAKHTFDPLTDITYRRAQVLKNVLDARFRGGDSTLTKESGLSLILRALLDNPQNLATLIPRPNKGASSGQVWAYEKLQELLLSPVLEPVLTRPTNLSFKGTIVARLDRAVLGDDDCLILGNLLMSMYPGQVIVTDFGFYGRRHHIALLRQDRLIAHVRSLEELPDELRRELLFAQVQVPSQANADDAETLAVYNSGFPRGTEGFTAYVQKAMKPRS